MSIIDAMIENRLQSLIKDISEGEIHTEYLFREAFHHHIISEHYKKIGMPKRSAEFDEKCEEANNMLELHTGFKQDAERDLLALRAELEEFTAAKAHNKITQDNNGAVNG